MTSRCTQQILEMTDHNPTNCETSEEPDQQNVSLERQISELIRNYCKAFIPSPNRPEEDESNVLSDRRDWRIRLPPLTIAIFSLLEIFAFYADKIYLSEVKCPNDPGPARTLFHYSPHRRSEVWRFFTYIFVHSDGWHLVFNVIIQILLGVPLELVHRWWRVALIYLAGVAAGSMGVAVISNTCLIGASPGVYALIIAHIVTIIKNWEQMEFAIIQLSIFILYFVMSSDIIINRENSKTSYVSHASGAVAGLLIGVGVLINLKKRERKYWHGAVIFYCLLMFTGIFLLSFAKHNTIVCN